MTIEEQLRELILSRYNSLREFTLVTGIAYSTFDSILRRGIANATISNIIKICETLHISADALANGKIVYQHEITKNKPKDVRDILANARQQLLSCDGLMFDGKPADPEAIESIINAMEVGMELARRKK